MDNTGVDFRDAPLEIRNDYDLKARNMLKQVQSLINQGAIVDEYEKTLRSMPQEMVMTIICNVKELDDWEIPDTNIKLEIQETFTNKKNPESDFLRDDSFNVNLEKDAMSESINRFQMIHCPACGKEVSEKAVQCPACGHPVRQTIRLNRARDVTRGIADKTVSGIKIAKPFLKTIGKIAIIIFVSLGVFGIKVSMGSPERYASGTLREAYFVLQGVFGILTWWAILGLTCLFFGRKRIHFLWRSFMWLTILPVVAHALVFFKNGAALMPIQGLLVAYFFLVFIPWFLLAQYYHGER